MLIKFRSHGAFCPHPLRPTFPARPAVRVHAKPDTQEGPSAPVIAPTFTALEPIHLLDELLRGHVLAKAKASFPAVPWGAAQIAQVLAGGTMALLAAALVTTPGISPSFSTSVQGLAQVIGSEEQQVAVMHVGRELLLLSATGSLLAATLHSSSPRSKGLFSFQMRRPWLAATCAVCAVAFPLADPVLTNVTAQALTLLLGSDAAASPAGGQLADSIRACVAANDLGSLSLHVLAGGLLGPLWEETFWRGFILTSMTRVLPLQFCVALSSTWFALLHLTPSSALPIWLLAACSDVLYLRSASLAPPLMLHALWNTSQILAVAYLGKESDDPGDPAPEAGQHHLDPIAEALATCCCMEHQDSRCGKSTSSLLSLGLGQGPLDATDPEFLRDLSTFLSAMPSELNPPPLPAGAQHSYFLDEGLRTFLLDGPNDRFPSLPGTCTGTGLELRAASGPTSPDCGRLAAQALFSTSFGADAPCAQVVSMGPALLVRALEAELYSTTEVIMAALRSDEWHGLTGAPAGSPALDAGQRSKVLSLVQERLATPDQSAEVRSLCLQLQEWVRAMQ